ncbi:MAG: tRNA (adenosine(37)-N6)-threonylcarbamoyltransferase complex dimerization subunit type 1 TsaB [Treponema sp.]|jgi:tRNA threonylcarbamoyladenosine biosynthesis protein TsaB|nr:tRNA (adenosine(37)-N6)-threonylcarbamoyltransferase complex dimerization subunit type 1 TsaB [Treponema sp.]
MNMIAFDCAGDVFSAALSFGEKRYYLEIDGGMRHSELIMKAADMLLSTAGLSQTELEAAACMEGPGSFTGLRIAYAAVKGLALALNIPLVAVPTLDCYAAPYSVWPGMVITVMDAKQHAFYSAFYRDGGKVSDYLDKNAGQLLDAVEACLVNMRGSPAAEIPLLLCGPGASLFKGELEKRFPKTSLAPFNNRGHAYELLNFALKKSTLYSQKDRSEALDGGPVYLRKSDAEMAVQKRNGE